MTTTVDTRALDAEVAERVMGWTEVREWGSGYVDRPDGMGGISPTGKCIEDIPSCLTDPAADYEVLRHVRETWDHSRQYQFAHALAELYRSRKEGRHPVVRYQPGDYSRAALAALNGETER